jgi:hypothetical protein
MINNITFFEMRCSGGTYDFIQLFIIQMIEYGNPGDAGL